MKGEELFVAPISPANKVILLGYDSNNGLTIVSKLVDPG